LRQDVAEYAARIELEEQLIVCDAFTSEGLLISVPEDEAKNM
jgi:selenophosphate synthase